MMSLSMGEVWTVTRTEFTLMWERFAGLDPIHQLRSDLQAVLVMPCCVVHDDMALHLTSPPKAE